MSWLSGTRPRLDERCIHNFRLEVAEFLPVSLEHGSREVVHHFRHLGVEIVR